MPFFMHYNDRDEPLEVSESEAQRLIKLDLQTTYEAMWQRLLRGEKVHVRLGYLTWERLTT